MAYIDTNKITIPKGFFKDLNVPKLFKWLDSQPEADVVEVVRCKDCKFAYKNRFLGEFHCEKTNCKIKQHHFCSQGISK